MSSSEGKAWIRDRVTALARSSPLTVLDVGPGMGTYADLFAGVPIASLVGLEVWEPYVERYRLRERYDEIVIGDVRSTPLPEVDVVVLGDVLEHMTRDEGVAVWERAATAARRAVYLSIPVIHYPQHDLEGNPYEVHVEEDWTHEDVLTRFPGVGAFELGAVVGVYERLTSR